MEDFTIIQGQALLEVLLALLLTLVTSYAYFWCAANARRLDATHSKAVVDGLKMLGRMHAPEGQEYTYASVPRALWQKHKHAIESWLAPLVVWSAVIWILLAIVSVFLADN